MSEVWFDLSFCMVYKIDDCLALAAQHLLLA